MSSPPSSHPDPRETLRQLSRDPTVDPDTPETPADRFCRLACLVYSEVDHPDRWAAARALLAEHPETNSIAAAAAAADPDALAAHLAADPEAADRETGPHRWAPLLYLTYSRAVLDGSADRYLRCARLLLDAGADPNAGYLWQGLPSPFTALTGVFGEGEQGAGKQPRHPHSLQLARLLLTAGASPNDGQSLYNRMFRPDNDHLLLLFEFGLGRVGGGHWAELLDGFIETPEQMLARQLGWAIDHGFGERVELLIANVVDVSTPLADGQTPAEHALHAGYREIIVALMGSRDLWGDARRLLEFGFGDDMPPDVDPRTKRQQAVLRNREAIRSSSVATAKAAQSPQYAIHVGVFDQKDRAERLSRALGRRGFDVAVDRLADGRGRSRRVRYRVQVGPYNNRGQAESAARSMAAQVDLPTRVVQR